MNFILNTLNHPYRYAKLIKHNLEPIDFKVYKSLGIFQSICFS
jgi:hypothetical protein